MIRVVAGTLLVLGLLAAPASATRLTGPSARLPEFQRWVDAARVPTPPGRIVIIDGPCPASRTAKACTSSRAATIYMTAAAGRHQLLHELGHQFDARMSPATRTRFMRIIGRPGASWLVGPPVPAEQFADAYALCAVDPRMLPLGFTSIVGYQPTAAQHRAVCRLVVRAGRALSR